MSEDKLTRIKAALKLKDDPVVKALLVAIVELEDIAYINEDSGASRNSKRDESFTRTTAYSALTSIINQFPDDI